MKILLTGKNGQVGFELRRALATIGHVQAMGTAECDLCDEAATRKTIRAYRPDVIVNSAAYTAVDKAESDIERAYLINAYAPTLLAEEAQALNAMIVHYSTDYVFDGCKIDAYVESDMPNPLGVYGASKLAGEYGVARTCDRHLILRTSWVIGAHGGNFAKTILRLASEKDILSIVSDQWGAPTPASFLADITAHLVRQAHHEGFPFGLYHVAGAGQTNWHSYAMYVIGRARQAGWPIRVASDAIRAITTSDYPSSTKRPINSCLDSTKLRTTFGLHLPEWRAGVDHILDQIFDTEQL